MESEESLYWDEPPLEIGVDCCPHYVPYGSDCDECDQDDIDESMGLGLAIRTSDPNEQGQPTALNKDNGEADC